MTTAERIRLYLEGVPLTGGHDELWTFLAALVAFQSGLEALREKNPLWLADLRFVEKERRKPMQVLVNPVALVTGLGPSDRNPEKAIKVVYCSRCFVFHPLGFRHRSEAKPKKKTRKKGGRR